MVVMYCSKWYSVFNTLNYMVFQVVAGVAKIELFANISEAVSVGTVKSVRIFILV